jgi:hypothetical protein
MNSGVIYHSYAAAASVAYLHDCAGIGNFTHSAAHAESSRGTFKDEALLVEEVLRMRGRGAGGTFMVNVLPALVVIMTILQL